MGNILNVGDPEAPGGSAFRMIENGAGHAHRIQRFRQGVHPSLRSWRPALLGHAAKKHGIPAKI